MQSSYFASLAVGAALMASAVGAVAQASAPAAPAASPVTARFADAKGAALGVATLRQTSSGVLIELDLKGLPPGEHGFHVHETGTCNGADGFKSAGGHWMLPNQAHGMAGGKPFHAGDMPNQFVAADGRLKAHVLNSNARLQGPGSLFDKDGAALVLHAKADDYRSQPAGDSGDRIACAVIERAASR